MPTSLQYNEAALSITKTASLVNQGNDFILVVGINVPVAIQTDGQSVQIVNAQNQVINEIILTHTGTAASEYMVYLPKNMLVPPGAWVRTTNGCFCQYVSGKLSDLVAGL